MAATRKGKASVTATAQSLGDAVTADFIFKNVGTNTVYLDCGGNTAETDKGMYLVAGEMVTNKDLPEFFRRGPWSAVCAAAETASLYYHFSKPRGS